VELTGQEVRHLIDQAALMAIPRITFFGGEPLVREDIYDLIKYANSKGMMTRINTNGLALTEEVVVKLKEAGLTHCDVSIDSADPGTHDGLRGVPGLFAKAVEGIRILRSHKVLCQIVTYAGKRTLDGGLARIIELGRELRVLSVSIVFPMATGCWFESAEELLNEEERRKVRDMADAFFVHVELPTPKNRCNVARKASLYVSPDGEVTPCPFIPWSVGNVRDRELKVLFESFSATCHSELVGDCIMNDVKARDSLRTGIESARTSCSSASSSPTMPEVADTRSQAGSRAEAARSETEVQA